MNLQEVTLLYIHLYVGMQQSYEQSKNKRLSSKREYEKGIIVCGSYQIHITKN